MDMLEFPRFLMSALGIHLVSVLRNNNAPVWDNKETFDTNIRNFFREKSGNKLNSTLIHLFSDMSNFSQHSWDKASDSIWFLCTFTLNIHRVEGKLGVEVVKRCLCHQSVPLNPNTVERTNYESAFVHWRCILNFFNGLSILQFPVEWRFKLCFSFPTIVFVKITYVSRFQ